MKLSRFFEDLSGSYGFEIEDLTYDSAGEDVLKKRLKSKRNQLPDLMMMAATDPVMVAPVFHGAFRFVDTKVMDRLVACESEELLPWGEVRAALDMDHWVEHLIERVMESEDGERFMCVAAGLEYIESGPSTAPASKAGRVHAGEEADEDEDLDADDEGSSDDFEGDDADDRDGVDLGEAGEDWLDDQGFDRRE